jgi:hypothetical protein
MFKLMIVLTINSESQSKVIQMRKESLNLKTKKYKLNRLKKEDRIKNPKNWGTMIQIYM